MSGAGRRFEVRPEHISLLSRMVVGWNPVEYGAPEIDPKRPYGNSYVVGDIREILSAPNLSEERARELHEEMQTVLEILVRNQQVKPFTEYETTGEYKRDWKEVVG